MRQFTLESGSREPVVSDKAKGNMMTVMLLADSLEYYENAIYAYLAA